MLINVPFLPEVGVDAIDKEVYLNIELEFHGLDVARSHGDWDVLCEPAHESVSVSLIECLNFKK